MITLKMEAIRATKDSKAKYSRFHMASKFILLSSGLHAPKEKFALNLIKDCFYLMNCLSRCFQDSFFDYDVPRCGSL